MLIDEETPRQMIIGHQEDLTAMAQDLLSDFFPRETLEEYNDLMWQIRSIEASVDCQNMNEDTVHWVLRGRFLKCPLRPNQNSSKEKLCVEVDCPRFNSCELTLGILDKYL